jgi:hypothetical protein
VYEHRDIEVSLREHLGYMRKVHPNVVFGGIVLRIVCADLDNAAILPQDEMVSRFVL